MKFRRYIIERLLIAVLATVLLSGCSLIDDELGECGHKAQDHKLNYELRLVTNITTEMHTQLGQETDAKLATALSEHLSGIFTDYAHDVDLSFYDTVGDSVRLQHEKHIMDASQRSYTLNLPKREYMHLAIANTEGNRVVNLTNDERCHPSRLETVASWASKQTQADTIDSHTTGLFTARQSMTVKDNIDQTFNVRLYMANCAAALVVEPRSHDVSSMRVFTTGFATQYNICDSSYTFAAQSPIVRTTKVATDNTSDEVCYVSVNFPSREPKTTRTVIETTEPFIAQEGDETLWQFRAYITKADGTVTETILSLRKPLRAGQLKIIRGYVTSDGVVQTDDHTVGVSVTLDWKEGMHHDIPL